MSSRTLQLQAAMKMAGVPDAERLQFWTRNAHRISVSMLDDNLDRAMNRLTQLRKGSKFGKLYDQLNDDEKEVLTMGVIAIEDLKTLDDMVRYKSGSSEHQAEIA